MVQKACSTYTQSIAIDSYAPVWKAMDMMSEHLHGMDSAIYYADPQCTQPIFEDQDRSLIRAVRDAGLGCVYPIDLVPEAVFHIYAHTPGHSCCDSH